MRHLSLVRVHYALFLGLLSVPFIGQAVSAQIPVRQVDVAAVVNDQSLATVEDAATINMSGRAGVCAQVTGTHSMTLSFEVTADGGDTWVPLSMFPTNSTTSVTSISGGSNGIWCASTSAESFRVRNSADTSGTAVVDLYASMSSNGGGGGAAGGGDASAANQTTMITALQLIDNLVGGTAGTPDADVLSVQGIASGTPLDVDNAGTFAVQVDAFPDNEPFNIAQVGGAAVPVFGTTTYTEATSAGVLFGGVRNDALATLASVDNEIAPFQFNADGGLWTVAYDPNTAAAVSYASDATNDDTALTTGPQAMLRSGDFDEAALPGAVGTEGDAVQARASLSGVAYVMPVNEDGSGQAQVETLGQNDIQPIHCGSTAWINMTTATTTQIVALSGSTQIYVCSYAIHVSATTDLKFVAGTGSNCAMGQEDVSASWNITATDWGLNRNAGGGNVVIVTDAADALCVTSSAAIDADIEVSYAQF